MTKKVKIGITPEEKAMTALNILYGKSAAAMSKEFGKNVEEIEAAIFIGRRQYEEALEEALEKENG